MYILWNGWAEWGRELLHSQFCWSQCPRRLGGDSNSNCNDLGWTFTPFNTRHRLIGQSSRRCEISGGRVEWSGAVPICQSKYLIGPRVCMDLVNISYDKCFQAKLSWGISLLCGREKYQKVLMLQENVLAKGTRSQVGYKKQCLTWSFFSRTWISCL